MITATLSATRKGRSGASGMLVVHVAAASSAIAVRRMWPAIMLARSRTDSENGRTMNFEMNSIGATRTSIAFGTPGGMTEPLRYCHGPCTAIPTTIMMTYDWTAR